MGPMKNGMFRNARPGIEAKVPPVTQATSAPSRKEIRPGA